MVHFYFKGESSFKKEIVLMAVSISPHIRRSVQGEQTLPSIGGHGTLY